MVGNTTLLHVPVRTVFLLDGAPSHFSRRVSAFLDREFPDRWIGKRGQIPCPPLYSLDFFILEVSKGHCLP